MKNVSMVRRIVVVASVASAYLGVFGTSPAAADVAATAVNVSATEHVPFTGSVATFTTTDPTPAAGNFSATIDWGDGTPTSAGTITGTGPFTVSGTHTFGDESSLSMTVTITDNTVGFGGTDVARPTATVGEHDAFNVTTSAISATEGAVFTGTVASVTDTSDVTTVASDLTATIDWGDGTVTPGNITGGSGLFSVAGAHTYTSEGSPNLTVSVSDNAPGTATASNAKAIAVADADAFTVNVSSFNASEGVVFSGTVATFSDAYTPTVAADLTAVIDWGDTTTSPGTVTGSAGNFSVTGSHAYAEEGTPTVAVTVSEMAPGTATANASHGASVPDAPLSGSPVPITASSQQPVNGVVAHFFDADPNETPADYVATINWGDGPSTAGTVTAHTGGGFDASGTHSYSTSPPHSVTTTIMDAGGATTTVTSTVNELQGYWIVNAAGHILSGGDAQGFGEVAGHLNAPICAIVGTPSGHGYWLSAVDGGVFSFGDAKFFGSMGGTKLNQPVVGIAATPSGNGYWLVASDGGVFSFGDAKFVGSMGGSRLNKPVVGIVATRTGSGYWLVASDGGIFTFGDAKFAGSAGSIRLNSPIDGMARTPSSNGYWMVAKDGGVFTFGDAGFFGSAVPFRPAPVVALTPSPSGNGYWLAAKDGGVFSFGDAIFFGSGVPKGFGGVVGMASPSIA